MTSFLLRLMSIRRLVRGTTHAQHLIESRRWTCRLMLQHVRHSRGFRRQSMGRDGWCNPGSPS